MVPSPTEPTHATEKGKPRSAGKSRHIQWHELLRKTFVLEIVCQKGQSPQRLAALIKSEDSANKILIAMRLLVEVPTLHPARPPPEEAVRGSGDWVN